jgi:ribonuclease T1
MLAALVLAATGCASTATAPGATVAPLSVTTDVHLGGGLGATAPKGMATVQATDLPRQVTQVLALIDKGGPFPYRQDGVVFENREKLLPKKASGYYHEYTVPTPGSDDRGARRIVTGEGGERYYTDDHYDSFRWIVP